MSSRIYIYRLFLAVLLVTGCAQKEITPDEDHTGCTAGNEAMITQPYMAVDLGLSVKWGERNIGAVVPADYGDYFTWGDIDIHYEAGYAQNADDVTWNPGKVGYVRETYRFIDEGSWLSKYCTSLECGPMDGAGILSYEDDVANVRLGEKWRIPTEKEWCELSDPENCSWTWTIMDGVGGYRVQSRKEGFTDRWIFLPAAGERVGCVLFDLGSCGSYWASTVYRIYPYFAWGFDFSKDYRYRFRSYRYYGRTVRPVLGEEDPDPEDYHYKDVGGVSVENEGFEYR